MVPLAQDGRNIATGNLGAAQECQHHHCAICIIDLIELSTKAKAKAKGRTHGKSGQVLLPVGRSNKVDDDVDALASSEREHLVDPLALVFIAVNGLIGAQLMTEAQLIL